MGFTYRKYPEKYLTSKDGRPDSLYMVWYDMHKRCKENSRDKKNYFDKGITVCTEWGYWPNFCDWAKNNGWTPELELDRKDNTQGYYPANCRFVNETVQAQNQGRNYIPIICVQTGQVFPSPATAAAAMGLKGHGVRQSLHRDGTHKGFKFEYVGKNTTEDATLTA